MNINSFLIHKDLLPLCIKEGKDEINYYFDQDVEGYVLDFLKKEMPGIIIGEIDEDVISVIRDGEKLIGYKGQCFTEYYEPINGDRSIGSIKEIFCVDNEIDFYKAILKYRNSFSTKEFEDIQLSTLEQIFFEQFRTLGYEKLKITKGMTFDGYDECNIHFKNLEGKEISVFYPEYDYIEDSDYISAYSGDSYTWFDFFDALKNGDIMDYKGISFVN